VGRGQPVDPRDWPIGGPRRKFVEFLDKVRRDNGMKSIRSVGQDMYLAGSSRVSDLLHGRALPASEEQARVLVRALGGGVDDEQQGLKLYRRARSADDTGTSRRSSGRNRKELAELRAEAVARRVARLRAAAVPTDKIDAVVAWMDALAEPEIRVPAGGLRVLVGPMGAGKTEMAHRWFMEGIEAAMADPAARPPTWLDARAAVSGLRVALQAVWGSVVGDDGRCRIVLDRLNAIGAEQGRQVLDEARQLAVLWPGAEILITTRPGVPLAPDEEIGISPWSVDRGLQLAELLTGSYLPPGLTTAENVDAMRRPLSALAVAARLAAGQRTDLSRWELLAGLADQSIRACRPDEATPALWPLLTCLAQQILDVGAPIPAGQFGSHPEVWQVTDSGLVSLDRSGCLSFVLPVFELHFGAEAIRTRLLSIEEAAADHAFPRWRYAIVFAVGTARPDDAEGLLERLARANPGAACWVLGELSTDSATTRSAGGHGAPGMPASASGVAPAAALGQWLRGAQDAWLEGLGQLGKVLARHGADGRPVPWGIWLSVDDFTLAEARESGDGPVTTELPVPWPGSTLQSGWWRVEGGPVPTQPLGRWRWNQRRLRKALAPHLLRGTLPCTPDSPLARERLWLLAQLVATGRSFWQSPVSTVVVKDKVAAMLARADGAVTSRWQMSGYIIDQDDIRWMDATLRDLDEPELQCPAPRPDQPGVAGHLTYSPGGMLALAEYVLQAAITGYRHLVEDNFPSFGTALGLYSMLPVKITGAVEVSGSDGLGGDIGAICVFRPAHGQRSTVPSVSLAPVSGIPGQHDVTCLLKEGTGDSDSPVISPFATASIRSERIAPYLPRPATQLAYGWLIRDLSALGWAEHGLHLAR
jgi:hypothetical protein